MYENNIRSGTFKAEMENIAVLLVMTTINKTARQINDRKSIVLILPDFLKRKNVKLQPTQPLMQSKEFPVRCRYASHVME